MGKLDPITIHQDHIGYKIGLLDRCTNKADVFFWVVDLLVS
jgi:hypothetical protein